MVDPKLWPNVLSSIRIVLMPVLLAVAWADSRTWFLILGAVSLITDALDGYLARRLNAFSDFGRKLDSVADYLAMVTGLTGIAWLWPDMVRRELGWIVAGLVAFCGSVAWGFIRLGRAPCYHTWATKAGVVGCAFSLIPLFAGWSAVPFHVMIVLQVCAAFEVVTIALLLPSHEGDIATVWHASRARRRRLALARHAHRRAPLPARVD